MRENPFQSRAEIVDYNRGLRGLAKIVICSLAAAFGCGDDGGTTPPAPDTTGPTITNIVANESYEGDDEVSADVTDASGVASVVLQYRAAGSSDAWTDVPLTNISGDTWSATHNFAPDELEYRVVATDASPQSNASESAGNVVKYADEPREDIELPAKLASYAEVLDYGVNDSKGIDIGGTMVYPDWWALIENPSFPEDPDYGQIVVGWYQGPSDGDHAAEKQLCEDYYTPWAQIDPCPQDEIGPKLDEIRAAGWASGQIK